MKRLYEHWIDPEETFFRHKKQDGLDYFTAYAQEIMQIVAHLQGKYLSTFRSPWKLYVI